MGNKITANECKNCCCNEAKTEVDTNGTNGSGRGKAHMSYINRHAGTEKSQLPSVPHLVEQQPGLRGSPVFPLPAGYDASAQNDFLKGQQARFCTTCFKVTDASAKFCSECGAPQKSLASAMAPNGGQWPSQPSSGGKNSPRTAADWANDQAQFNHMPQLPEGWIRVTSRSTGEIYYCCTATGETTFEEPKPSQAVAKSEDLPPGWVEMTSKTTGRKYYYNTLLQKSQFDRPESLPVTPIPTSVEQPRTRPAPPIRQAGTAAPDAAPQPQVPAAVSNKAGLSELLGGGWEERHPNIVPFPAPLPEPAIPPAPNADASLPAGWVSMMSRSTGQTYYYNEALGTSQFERPSPESKN